MSFAQICGKTRAAAIIDVHGASGVELNLDRFTDIRFGQDRRLHEVAQMLQSSSVPTVHMPERPDMKYVWSQMCDQKDFDASEASTIWPESSNSSCFGSASALLLCLLEERSLPMDRSRQLLETRT